MRYHFETCEQDLARMRQMVRKLCPVFREDQDYCLWLVFDWSEKSRYGITAQEAKVVLKDADEKELSLLPEKASLMVRKPYPDKSISQAGVKYGTKRIFGIPVVAPDLETLCRIRSVSVTWFCLYPTYAGEKRPARAKVTRSDFLLDWREITEADGHWFTIARKEESGNCQSSLVETGTRYENGRILPGAIADPQLVPFARVWSVELEEDLRRIIERHRQIPAWKHFCRLEDPVELTFCFHRTNLVMEPGPYADFVPDPRFGFSK